MVIASALGVSVDEAKVRAVLAAVPGVTGVESTEGEGSGTLGFLLRCAAEDPRRALFDAVVQNQWMLLEVRRQQVSLEETFRKLTAATGTTRAAA